MTAIRTLEPDWLTSDQHWSHARICELAARPYRDAAEMNEDLVRRWNEVVAPEDTVLVLGDWALGQMPDSLDVTRRLNGTLLLVPGNHDRCWRGHRKTGDWDSAYLTAGFAEIVHGRVRVQIGGATLAAGHFPYTADIGRPERFAEHRPTDRGEWLVHGHVHGAWRQRGRQVNVGVDAWNGYPVPAGTIAGLRAAGPLDLPPRPWTAPANATADDGATVAAAGTP